ncbi:DUF2129 domain-containing protein [Bacillus carboniphilus]|uniref:UPF0298 protein LC087_05720 n=1 Tax=Bacillus carboniphilus TaxID=86663 RepID=A0ABY9JW69_9BACI|nr:DUF2129 domain-containing protein [Bacillus carboniphilus]WLR43644.1 DUF2129 domain-containing protein [Bacillus carboniphilus]
MFEKRQGIAVYLHSLKHAKSLRRFGNVHYISKKMKYVIIYSEKSNVEQIVEKISSYSYVKYVEVSQKPNIKLEFESKFDKAKEYDYKMGL